MITTDEYPPITVRVRVEIDVKVFPYDAMKAIGIASDIIRKKLNIKNANITAAWIVKE